LRSSEPSSMRVKSLRPRSSATFCARLPRSRGRSWRGWTPRCRAASARAYLRTVGTSAATARWGTTPRAPARCSAFYRKQSCCAEEVAVLTERRLVGMDDPPVMMGQGAAAAVVADAEGAAAAAPPVAAAPHAVEEGVTGGAALRAGEGAAAAETGEWRRPTLGSEPPIGPHSSEGGRRE
jgi:hypothetical protein